LLDTYHSGADQPSGYDFSKEQTFRLHVPVVHGLFLNHGKQASLENLEHTHQHFPDRGMLLLPLAIIVQKSMIFDDSSGVLSYVPDPKLQAQYYIG
jgi:hypothetical protein